MALSDFKPRMHETTGGDVWDVVELKLSRRRGDGSWKLELGERGNGAFRTAADHRAMRKLLGKVVDRVEFPRIPSP